MTTFDWSRRGALAGGGAAVLLASTGGALRAFDAAGRPPTDETPTRRGGCGTIPRSPARRWRWSPRAFWPPTRTTASPGGSA